MNAAVCSWRVTTSSIFDVRSDSTTSRFSSPGTPKIRSTPSFSSAATSRSEPLVMASPPAWNTLDRRRGTIGLMSPGTAATLFGRARLWKVLGTTVVPPTAACWRRNLWSGACPAPASVWSARGCGARLLRHAGASAGACQALRRRADIAAALLIDAPMWSQQVRSRPRGIVGRAVVPAIDPATRRSVRRATDWANSRRASAQRTLPKRSCPRRTDDPQRGNAGAAPTTSSTLPSRSRGPRQHSQNTAVRRCMGLLRIRHPSHVETLGVSCAGVGRDCQSTPRSRARRARTRSGSTAALAAARRRPLAVWRGAWPSPSYKHLGRLL